MSNLTCLSPQVIKTCNLWKSNLGKRPKGLTDAQWDAMRKEEKLNKLIVLNAVPKASRATPQKRGSDE